jgi:hypothetical protein
MRYQHAAQGRDREIAALLSKLANNKALWWPRRSSTSSRATAAAARQSWTGHQAQTGGRNVSLPVTDPKSPGTDHNRLTVCGVEHLISPLSDRVLALCGPFGQKGDTFSTLTNVLRPVPSFVKRVPSLLGRIVQPLMSYVCP